MTEKPRHMGRPAKRPQTFALQKFIPILCEARRRYGKLTDADKQLLYVLSGGNRSAEKEIAKSYKSNTPINLVLDLEYHNRTNNIYKTILNKYDEHHRKVSSKRKIGQRNRRQDERENTDAVLLKIAKILSMLRPSGHLSVSRAATLAKKQLDQLNLDFSVPSERTLRRLITAYQSTKLATQGLEKSN